MTYYPQNILGRDQGRFYNFEKTLSIFGTGVTRNLKFCVWTEYVTCWPASDKLPLKGACPALRDRFWNFATLSLSLERLKVRTCNFVYLIYVRYKLVVDKLPPKGHRRARDGFGMLGHLSISRTGVARKFTCDVWMEYVMDWPDNNNKLPSNGAWPRSRDRSWNFGTPHYLWSGWSYGLEIWYVDGIGEVLAFVRQIVPKGGQVLERF